ncbi:MAG: hypothetical protein RLZZ450_1420 [Pseudomonadota bacterium]
MPFRVPRVLAHDEIPNVVRAFGIAATNARRAGFDGVEIHGANGFLVDQFLRDGANLRTDEHGGSAENRARFLLAVVDAASDAFGADRVGIRVSPHATADGTTDSAPQTTYRYVAEQLSARQVAYLHLIEPVDTPAPSRVAPLLRSAFSGPLILCGGFDQTSATEAVREGRADAIAFGVGYIANPDLVERLRRGAAWNTPDPTTFYTGGDQGYIDYPFLSSASLRAEPA